MQTEWIIAGFGGQGVLFAGQLLSYAAMDAGLEVTWIPSYGPEMRGGTANCTVIISDQEIGSPLVQHPQAVIAMNLPSLDKYEPLIARGGTGVVNSSIVTRGPQRSDVTWVPVPANQLAEALGDRRMTNMVLLGALLARLPILPSEALEQALHAHLPERHSHLLQLNVQALRKGAQFAVQPAA
jgi:2-oxoglutarate ferredoxin oxidoreductase subunit gamma